MKTYKIIILFLLFVSMRIPVFALIDTVDTDKETYDRLMNDDCVIYTTDEELNLPITGFSVSDDGTVAIVHSNPSEQDYINIYSSEGEFVCCYHLDSAGEFVVEWNGKNLNIYYWRGSIAQTIDPSGKTIDIKEISQSKENNNNLYELDIKNEFQCGNAVYKIEGKKFMEYSRMVKYENGIKTTIYDATEIVNKHIFEKCVYLIGVVLFVVALLCWILYKRNHLKKDEDWNAPILPWY